MELGHGEGKGRNLEASTRKNRNTKIKKGEETKAVHETDFHGPAGRYAVRAVLRRAVLTPLSLGARCMGRSAASLLAHLACTARAHAPRRGGSGREVRCSTAHAILLLLLLAVEGCDYAVVKLVAVVVVLVAGRTCTPRVDSTKEKKIQYRSRDEKRQSAYKNIY